MKLWTKFTDLEPARQGPALVMSLEGKALDIILELDDKDISHNNGVTTIINKLNSLYKKDKLNEKFEGLERFESYKRSPEMQMQQFVAEFDQASNKLKKHGITICSDLLDFKLLKAANLSHHHEQLIKATITEVSYDNIIKKIKSIFSNETEKSSTQELQIKVEPTYYTKEITSDEEDYDNKSYDTIDTKCDIADTYYTQDNYRRSHNSKFKYQYQNPKQRHNFTQKTPSNWRNNPQRLTKGRNPQKNGQPTRYNICQNINHWATQCPDKNLEVSCMVHEIIRQNSSDKYY